MKRIKGRRTESEWRGECETCGALFLDGSVTRRAEAHARTMEHCVRVTRESDVIYDARKPRPL